MSVPAKPLWKDTGIDVVANRWLLISATGTWTWKSGQVAPFGPNGDGTATCSTYCYDLFLRTARHGQLIGYIGPVGLKDADFGAMPQNKRFFAVGKRFATVVPRTGRLYLGINDAYSTATQSFNGSADNAGTLSVNVRGLFNPFDPPIGGELGPRCESSEGCHKKSATAMRADPVNTATGSFYHSETDITLPGLGASFVFTRSYNSLDPVSPFGQGWTGSYQDSLSASPDGTLLFRADDGQQLVFTPQSGGGFASEPGVLSTLTVSNGTYTLLRNDQMRYVFDVEGNLLSKRDPNGHTITFTRDANGKLTSITDTAGRVIAVATDSEARITKLTLPDGRNVRYTYDGKLLTAVKDLAGATTSYEYDEDGRLTAIIDANGHRTISNVYGDDGRVSEQTDALGKRTTFAWDATSQTSTMTDARGGVWRDVYADNVLLRSIDPLGNMTTHTFDAARNELARTDARGNTTSMTYDARGNMLTRTAPAPLSYVETFTYDAQNRLLTHTDGRGATTRYTYDADGNMLSMVEPDGATITYTYDAHGQRTSVTNANGHTTRYAYDTAGNLIRETSPLGHAETTTYDQVGRKTSEVEERGNAAGANPDDYRRRFTYDGGDRVLTTTDPLGHVTRNAYDAVGNLLTVTDATGAVTTYTYDAADQRVSETAPDGGTTTYQFDESGHLTATTDPLGNVTTQSYDLADRRITMVTARGNAPGASPASFRWSYTYDPNGNLLTTTDPLGHVASSTYDALNRVTSSTDAIGRVTTFSYDAAGNRTAVTDAQQGTTSTAYDLRGRATSVTDPTGRTTTTTYDAVGNRTAVTSPLGGTTTFAYDADNQQISTVDPRGNASGANPAVYRTTYEYDAAGHRTKVTDPLGHSTISTYDAAGNRTADVDALGRATTYVYDAANRLTAITDPLGNTTATVYDAAGMVVARADANGQTTTYQYDLAHRLTDTVSPLGQRWTSRYDADGHRIAVVDPRGHAAANPATGTTEYVYDAAGRHVAVDYGDATKDVAYTLDASGAVRAMADGQGKDGTESYTLDALGRRTAVTRDGASIKYQYDAAGRVTQRTYPTGPTGKPFVETMTYDGDGRLATVAMNGATVATLTYDAAGNLLTRTLGNNTVETRRYDAAGRVLEITHAAGARTLVRLTYTYDAVGNPTVVASGDGEERYTYDDGDRLTKVCYTPACTEPDSFIAYTYDAVGNRLTETRSSGTTTYTYDDGDQLTNVTAPGGVVTSYAYDAAGNQTAAGTARYEYDLANRLIVAKSRKSWTYAYDGNGRKLAVAKTGSTVPTTRYLWDDNGPLPLLVLESKGSGSELRRYVDAEGPIASGKGVKLATYYHLDQMGSVRAQTTNTGLLLGTESYEPFGADRQKLRGKLKKNSVRFAGEHFDLETGLYDLRARRYDPTTGRFLGRDPQSRGTDETLESSYIYASNRPTVLVDPTGERPEKRYSADEQRFFKLSPAQQKQAAAFFRALQKDRLGALAYVRGISREQQAFYEMSPADKGRAIAYFKAVKRAADIKLWNDTVLWNNTVKWNAAVAAGRAHKAVLMRRVCNDNGYCWDAYDPREPARASGGDPCDYGMCLQPGTPRGYYNSGDDGRGYSGSSINPHTPRASRPSGAGTFFRGIGRWLASRWHRYADNGGGFLPITISEQKRKLEEIARERLREQQRRRQNSYTPHRACRNNRCFY